MIKSIKIPKVLESCCDVLNANYTKGEKCPILGRDTEISSMWNNYSKKTKIIVISSTTSSSLIHFSLDNSYKYSQHPTISPFK